MKKKRAKEGDGDEARGQESMKGWSEGFVRMESVCERKENDCACVSVAAQPPDRFSVGVIDPVSCEGELIYSVL